MGGYMAKNLLQNGYPIVVNDVYPEATAEIHELGGEVVETPAEVAEKVDRIVTMLPSSPNVLEVYNGPNGILGWVLQDLRK